jgi:hypothetical protein
MSKQLELHAVFVASQLCWNPGSLSVSVSGSLKDSLAQAQKSMFLQRWLQNGRQGLLAA